MKVLKHACRLTEELESTLLIGINPQRVYQKKKKKKKKKKKGL